MTPFRGKLKTRHLEIVLMVAELGNLSKAATQLQSTQSGLSRAIAEIEELAGGRLFERSAKGMACTPLGDAMCRHARVMLSSMRKAEAELDAVARGDSGSIVVGCLSMFAGWPLGDAVKKFREAYPGISLTVETGAHDKLLEELDNGAIDVLISRFSSTVNPEIYRSVALSNDSLAIVCAKEHPLAASSELTLQACVAYPWITALPGSPVRADLEAKLHAANLPVPTMIGAMSMEFGHEMLRGGHYLWILPGIVAGVLHKRGTVHALPLKLNMRRGPLAAIWRRDKSSTRQVRAFSTMLAQIVKEEKDALLN
jgi:DNA-binding transcriptional LysR family regulator